MRAARLIPGDDNKTAIIPRMVSVNFRMCSLLKSECGGRRSVARIGYRPTTSRTAAATSETAGQSRAPQHRPGSRRMADRPELEYLDGIELVSRANHAADFERIARSSDPVPDGLS